MAWSEAARQAAAEARRRKGRSLMKVQYGYSVTRNQFAKELRAARRHERGVFAANPQFYTQGIKSVNNLARGMAMAKATHLGRYRDALKRGKR